MRRSGILSAAVLSAALVVGCKEEPKPAAPAPKQPAAAPAATPAPGTPPATPPAKAGPVIPVVAIDMTPPNVPLVKYEAKVDDREVVFEAPAGCTVKSGSDVGVTDGKGFGFRITAGRSGLEYDRKWWKDGGGIFRPKSIAHDTADAFMVESEESGPNRYSAAAGVTLPYTDLSVHSAKDGGMGADVQSKENCLLVLRCAKTIALKAPPPTDPEAALKWLKVDVRKDDDSGKVVGLDFPLSTTDSALALAAKFPTVKFLSLSGSKLTANGLAVLGSLPNLESLELGFWKTDTAMLAHVGKATKLKTLKIGSGIGASDIEDAGLASLAPLTALEELNLMDTRAGDGALAAIKGMKGLKVLRLGNRQGDSGREKPDRMKLSPLTDAGLANLAGLTSLEVLDLRRTDITGAGLSSLTGLPNLKELDLGSTFLSDAGMPHVGAAKSLQTLKLGRTNVTDAGLKSLSGLSKLQELELTETDVTDAGLAHVAGLKELETLRLMKTNVGDAGLAHLKGLEKLSTLNLSKTKVTDAGLMQLVGLKKLYSLYTDGGAVTKEGKAKFEKARDGE